MNTIAEQASSTVDIKSSFEKFENSLNGSKVADIHKIRKQAFTKFQETGFPKLKDEEYKYTHIGKALEKHIDLDVHEFSIDSDLYKYQEYLITDFEGVQLVFVNGILSTELSSGLTNDGITILSFESAIEQYPEEVNNHFSKYADFNKDSFIALNTAFSKNGVFIKFEDNNVFEKPIVINYINDGENQKPISYPRNLILLGKNSQANIIETHFSLGKNPSFTNSLSEILVTDNAKLNFCILQDESESSYHISTTQINQVAPSTIDIYTISLNGAMIRNNLNIVIDSDQCESNMYGMYLLNGKAHVDNHTMVDHKKPHSYSNELYKGIMDDSSTGVFNGKIYVRQIAQKTNAFQSNKNIILDNNATINTKPQLEIWADDVRCTHGCTTGQLDQEQIFYLQSRGVSRDKAVSMLLYAFLNDIVEKIKIPVIKDYVHERLTKRLSY